MRRREEVVQLLSFNDPTKRMDRTRTTVNSPAALFPCSHSCSCPIIFFLKFTTDHERRPKFQAFKNKKFVKSVGDFPKGPCRLLSVPIGIWWPPNRDNLRAHEKEDYGSRHGELELFLLGKISWNQKHTYSMVCLR